MMLIELIDSNYQIHYILYLIISSFIFDFRIEIIAAAGGRRPAATYYFLYTMVDNLCTVGTYPGQPNCEI